MEGGGGTTYIDDKDVALVPVDAGLELMLPFVHLLEPLAGNDFVLLDAGELELVRMKNGSDGLRERENGTLTCGGTATPSEPSSFLKVCGGSKVLLTTALV